jgi:PAS domain S-box-containing protein
VYTPTHGRDGGVDGWVTTMLDITERKRAEATLRRSEGEFRSFFELGTFGAVQAEPHSGRLLRVNERFCQIAGRPRHELLGTSVLDLVHPDERESDWEKFQRMVRGETDDYTAEKRYIRKDGGIVWVYVAARLVRDAAGKPVRTIGTVIDITQRREAQERLHQQARLLARSVSDLEDFAHITAHDLKEPLRGMRLTIGMLKEDAAARLNADDVSRLDKLDALSARMDDLLDATLRYSRVGHDPLNPTRTDMGGVAAEAVESLRPMLSESGARVEIMPDLPTVECDRTLVRQVLANLIANAVKYNVAREKRVVVSADAGGPVPVFSVKDNGIGIAPDHRDDIFQMFKRLHGRDDSRRGTGAGLAIVKRIVDRHGGRIWVESEPGQGSKFSFTLAPDPTVGRG